MMIRPIVEGQGEVAALPVLLRRLRDEAEAWNIDIARPQRLHRGNFVQRERLQIAVRVAALDNDVAAILLLLDADDDCPRELAPRLNAWATEAAGAKPCAVVMANREYEAWFLASIEALRGKASIRADATSHPDPEAPRAAKAELERRMHEGASYSPTVDQATLSAGLDLAQVYGACRSFRKLVMSFGTLVAATGVALPNWPPIAWGP